VNEEDLADWEVGVGEGAFAPKTNKLNKLFR